MEKKLFKKDEASTVGGIKGFSAPFGAEKKTKKDPNQPFTKKVKVDFQEAIARALLDDEDLGEVVKKIGKQWAYFDDETGAQKGSFPSRGKAWEVQRQRRKAKEIAKKQKVEPTFTPEVEKKPRIKRQPGTIPIPVRSTKKETLEHLKKVLKESFLSYVFEQTPVSDDAFVWDKFLEKLSRDTIFSDNKLKNILEKGIKSEVDLLNKSVEELKKVLQGTKSFEIQKSKIEKDPKSNKIQATFDVYMKENNKTLPFSIRLENSRPLIIVPDQSKNLLNSLANDESKLLRAELMHIQETILDNMTDVIDVNSKRNKYLRIVESKVDKILSQMNLLEIAMLKHLIRNKYKRGK
jgi:hypothetical protein